MQAIRCSRVGSISGRLIDHLSSSTAGGIRNRSQKGWSGYGLSVGDSENPLGSIEPLIMDGNSGWDVGDLGICHDQAERNKVVLSR